MKAQPTSCTMSWQNCYASLFIHALVYPHKTRASSAKGPSFVRLQEHHKQQGPASPGCEASGLTQLIGEYVR